MSVLNVYLVTFNSTNPRTGRPYFMLFECASPSMDALTDRLNGGELVRGNKLIWRYAAENGVREIIGREPAAVGKGSVGSLELPGGRLVEFEEPETGA